MTPSATIALLAGDNWNITVGGWIVVMLIGIGLCFVFMLGPMRLMRNGRGWSLCGRLWPDETAGPELRTATPVHRREAGVSADSEV